MAELTGHPLAGGQRAVAQRQNRKAILTGGRIPLSPSFLLKSSKNPTRVIPTLTEG